LSAFAVSFPQGFEFLAVPNFRQVKNCSGEVVDMAPGDSPFVIYDEEVLKRVAAPSSPVLKVEVP